MGSMGVLKSGETSTLDVQVSCTDDRSSRSKRRVSADTQPLKSGGFREQVTRVVKKPEDPDTGDSPVVDGDDTLNEPIEAVEGEEFTDQQLEYIKNGSDSYVARIGLESAKYLAEDSEEIRFSNLEKAAENIFANKDSISYEDFLKLTTRFYDALNLEKRGESVLLDDAKLLMKIIIKKALPEITADSSVERSNKLMVLGCGPGRLADFYVELARALNRKSRAGGSKKINKYAQIEEIHFNDLSASFVQATRDKIATLYNTGRIGTMEDLIVDDMTLKFFPGDFSEVQERFGDQMKYDIMVAWWYVLSEIIDPSSAENNRARRLQFFTKLRASMASNGVFLSDVPDSTLFGFYSLNRQLTREILRDRGILEGENSNFGLSYIPTNTGEKNHIRSLSCNGALGKEMRLCGFHPVFSCQEDVRESMRNMGVDFQDLFNGQNLRTVYDRIESMTENSIPPERKEEFVKKRRIDLWQAI